MSETFLHELDPNNFFYEDIVMLAYTQFGLNELFSRGFLIAGKKTHPNNIAFVHYVNSLNFPHAVNEQIFHFRGFTPMIFVPGFHTKDKKHVIQMEPNHSAVKFFQETKGITNKNLELTQLTIIATWEKIVHLNLADGPILQFFRHIRNAAAHNGKFHFTAKAIDPNSGEFIKSAIWESFEIKAAMQNMPLFVVDKNDVIGFLDQGDLVNFLLAFESHYPEIKTS